MKKTTRIAALLAAAALIFGGLFCSCSDDPEETTPPPDVDPAEIITAKIEYDGSQETNEPKISGEDGIFDAISSGKFISAYGVLTDYTVSDGYPKWETGTFTGDDSTQTTGAGIRVVSNLKDGNTKISISADTEVAFIETQFTLKKDASVQADVKAFNTQSANLKGKLAIKDSAGTEKTAKTAESGSKSANDVKSDSVQLAAGTYTLRFSWIGTKSAEIKKVNCGISALAISAEAQK